MRILLFISLICLSANGQITFQENILNDINSSVNFLDDTDVVDIDGDGDLDIVSSSRLDNKIAWYKNLDGQGTYSPLIIINDDNNDDSASIATVDLDGDGDIDIVSTSGVEHKLYWYKNLDGLGNFSEQIVISDNVDGNFDIEAADLDGDDDLDIVVSSFENSDLSWFENLDGNGNFSDIMRISNGYRFASKVALVDADNDGDIDLLPVNASTGTTLLWFENSDGQGQFIEHFYDSVALVTDIEYADFDGDSNIDIIVAGRTEANRYEYSSTTNNFEFIETIIDNDALKEFSVTDFDGDNDIDILYLSLFDDEVYVMRNTDGLGNFTTELVTNEVIRPRDSQPIDFDNDNDTDFIVTSETSDLLISYENIGGDGSFERKQYIANNADQPYDAKSFDIDGDGDLDILVASSSDNKVSWFENIDGQGNFDVAKIVSVTCDFCSSVNAADIDGDGDLDVLSSALFGDQSFWFENMDGEGNFGEGNLISELTGANYILPGDIDNDGDIDVVISVAEQNNSISWFENIDGLGNFSPAKIIETESGGTPYINLIDLNGDNRLDILSSDFFNDKTVWFENIDGNFSPQKIISTSTIEPFANVVTDIDNDGDNDVIVSSQSNIMLYRNSDGLGNFSSPEVLSSAINRIVSMKASDLDNDGDVDLVAADNIDDTFIWFENTDGLGNFGLPQIISENKNSPVSVNIGDIDSNGSLDIITTNLFNSVYWFSNSLVLGVNQENIVDFKVFPNPASTSLTLLTQDKVAQIEVFNILGELVLQDKDIIAPTVNISSLKSSVYFIKIKTADGKFGVQKFIKE